METSEPKKVTVKVWKNGKELTNEHEQAEANLSKILCGLLTAKKKCKKCGYEMLETYKPNICYSCRQTEAGK